MALHQSLWAKGRKQSPTPHMAGEVVNVLFVYSFASGADGAIADADTLEIGILPAGAKVVDMILLGNSGIALATATVGIMSGVAGLNDAARTVGTDFFAATDIEATLTRMSALTAFDVATATTDRGIGMTIAGDIVVGAGLYLKLSVSYRLDA